MKHNKIHVTMSPDKESGWWTAQVVEYPAAISQGRTIEQALKRVREALALVVTVQGLEIVENIVLPRAVLRMLEELHEAREESEIRKRQLEKQMRAVARKLRRMDSSYADAGRLLGVSKQRVHQVLADE